MRLDCERPTPLRSKQKTFSDWEPGGASGGPNLSCFCLFVLQLCPSCAQTKSRSRRCRASLSGTLRSSPPATNGSSLRFVWTLRQKPCWRQIRPNSIYFRNVHPSSPYFGALPLNCPTWSKHFGSPYSCPSSLLVSWPSLTGSGFDIFLNFCWGTSSIWTTSGGQGWTSWPTPSGGDSMLFPHVMMRLL